MNVRVSSSVIRHGFFKISDEQKLRCVFGDMCLPLTYPFFLDQTLLCHCLPEKVTHAPTRKMFVWCLCFDWTSACPRDEKTLFNDNALFTKFWILYANNVPKYQISQVQNQIKQTKPTSSNSVECSEQCVGRDYDRLCSWRWQAQAWGGEIPKLFALGKGEISEHGICVLSNAKKFVHTGNRFFFSLGDHLALSLYSKHLQEACVEVYAFTEDCVLPAVFRNCWICRLDK